MADKIFRIHVVTSFNLSKRQVRWRTNIVHFLADTMMKLFGSPVAHPSILPMY